MEPLTKIETLFRAVGRADLIQRMRELCLQWDGLEFDPCSYLAQNDDVGKSFADRGFDGPFQHFYLCGEAEGRRASGLSPYRFRNRMRATQPGGKPRIAFYAPISARSGLGMAANGYAKALQSDEWDLDVIDATDALYLAKRTPLHVPPIRDADVVVLHLNPEAFTNFFQLVDRSVLDEAYVIGIWVWELASFKAEWIDEYGAVDEIWCPSMFTADAVRSLAPAGLPIHVVHHAVEDFESVAKYDRAHFGLSDKAFTFLYVFDSSSVMQRKNPLAAVEAFRRAFKQRDDVQLVLKFHSEDANSSVREHFIRHAIGPNIILLDGFFNTTENRMLKRVVDGFVSPHRAEGFGINIAEAMLMGLPVIATDYSGSREFVSNSNAFLIDYDLATVTKRGWPYPAGVVWAEPDVAHLADLMRTVCVGGSEVRKKAAAAQQFVRTHLCLDAVKATIAKRIKAILSESKNQASHPRTVSAPLCYVWRHPSSLLPINKGDWLAALKGEALVSLLIEINDGDAPALRNLFNSLLQQTFPGWELCVRVVCEDAKRADTVVADIRGRDQRVRIVCSLESPVSGSRHPSLIEVSTGSVLAVWPVGRTMKADMMERFAAALSQWNSTERRWSGCARYDFKTDIFSEVEPRASNADPDLIFLTAKSALLRSLRREPQLAMGTHDEVAYSGV